jgi:NAD(P)-dependent dehydrogenase (short-subunit alcohol dehydrogenase family)
MSLRNILARFRHAGQNTLDLAMTVEARPSSLVHKDFREFTAPMRQQRGGVIRLVPGRPAASDWDYPGFGRKCPVNGILTPEVLVLGGTGAVGQGVVGALLEAGSPVLVVGRDPGRLAALHEQFADEPGLERCWARSAMTARHGRWPNASRSARVRWRGDRAMGGYRRGRVTVNGDDELLGAMQADLMPHVHAVRHLLPLLQDNVHARRYVMIGSPACQAVGGLRRDLDHHRAAHVRAGGAPGSAGAGRARADAGSLQPGVPPGQRGQRLHRVASSLLVGRRVVSLLDGAATTAPSSAATAAMPNCRAACCTWFLLWRDTAASLDLDHG